ncbi:MAG: AAA family ATPase [Parachlamydiales bacterium]|jgi:DNA polymerase-3 subunit delta'
MFDHLIGNAPIKNYLISLLDTQEVPHALLFAGPSGIGKSQFAQQFALALIQGGGASVHPDIHEYYPEGKSGLHSMETMRSFCDEVTLAPYKSPWKVFIIHHAERMQSYSANALLKTFEEPTPRTVIILVTESPESLIPTILSRCRTLPFKGVSVSELSDWIQNKYSMTPQDALTVARQAKGSVAYAMQLAENGESLFEEHLLPVLIQGRFRTYSELVKTAQSIASEIDALKTETEESSADSDLSAAQRARLEKSLAGTGTMLYLRQVQKFLEAISGWYRDIVLLKCGGDPEALWHAKCQQVLEKNAQQKLPMHLDHVLAAIKEALVSIQRASPLQSVLETLFLRLKLL